MTTTAPITEPARRLGRSSPGLRVGQDRPRDGASVLLGLSDEQVANALTYVYNNWENNGTDVMPEQVAAVRANPPLAQPPGGE